MRMGSRKSSAGSTRATPKRGKNARGKLAPGRSSRGLAAADVPIRTDDPEVAGIAALVIQAGGAGASE